MAERPALGVLEPVASGVPGGDGGGDHCRATLLAGSALDTLRPAQAITRQSRAPVPGKLRSIIDRVTQLAREGDLLKGGACRLIIINPTRQ